MSSKTISINLIILVMAATQSCQALASEEPDDLSKDSSLQVYLPREVTIDDVNLKLGQVSIIRGKEPLVGRANEILLGRISMPGQRIVVDSSVVLSRLASNGIPASKVTLTGAEKITINRQQQIIEGTEFVELASSFIKEKSSFARVCQLNPVRTPKALVVPGASRDIELSPRLLGSGTASRARVRIVVFADGKQIGAREVTFLLEFVCRRAVALVDIPARAVISADNVKIDKTVSNYPEPAHWSPPYGLIAKRHIAAGSVIGSHMVGSATPQVLVKRNQTVVIRIDSPGILVTAIGKATQDGRVGEYIKVQNKDSKRVILAKVSEDGTVEPVF